MRDDAVLRRALPLGRGLGRIHYKKKIALCGSSSPFVGLKPARVNPVKLPYDPRQPEDWSIAASAFN